jgi:hypothetical protein
VVYMKNLPYCNVLDALFTNVTVSGTPAFDSTRWVPGLDAPGGRRAACSITR